MQLSYPEEYSSINKLQRAVDCWLWKAMLKTSTFMLVHVLAPHQSQLQATPIVAPIEWQLSICVAEKLICCISPEAS